VGEIIVMDYIKDNKVPEHIRWFFSNFLVHSKGEHCGKNFLLLDWQYEIICDLFGTYHKEDQTKRRYNTAYLELPRKQGKALHINTPIPSPDGFIKMKDLKEGDVVYSGDGTPTKVVAATDVMHRQSYIVHFSDGTQMTACEDHLWEIGCVNTGRKNGKRWPEGQSYKKHIADTKWIKDNLYKGGTKGGRFSSNCYITIDHSIDGPDLDLPIDPYVLGVWLGDGTSANNGLTCNDQQIIEEIEKTGLIVHKGNQKYRYTIGYSQNTLSNGAWRNDFKEALRSLNILNNKHIPEIYFRASAKQRQALVQGLMDTDGYISSAKSPQIDFVNKNYDLADGLFILCRSLGIKARKVRSKICSCEYKGETRNGFYNHLYITADDSMPVFRLKRKLDRLRKGKTKEFDKTKTIYITKVTDVGIQPVKCIQVEHQSHTYLAGKQFLKTHNSNLAAGIALYSLIYGDQGGEVYCVAGSRDQAKVLYNIAVDFCRSNEHLKRKLKVHKNAIYNEGKKSVFRVLSRDSDTALGVNASLCIADELLVQPDSKLYDAMKTSMGARKNPLMISITTAGYNKTSFCYSLHEYADKVETGIISDDTFYSKIYGIKEGQSWEAESTWISANPSIGQTITLDFLRSEYKRAKEFSGYDVAFRTLYLNAWLSSNRSFLSSEQVKQCVVDGLKLEDFKGCDCWIGIDLGSTQDLTSFVLSFYKDSKYNIFPFCFCPEDNIEIRSKRDKVPYLQFVKEGLLTTTPGNATDYRYIIKKLEELSKDYNIRQIAIDPWNSTLVCQLLAEAGFDVYHFRQGYVSMTSPVRLLERLILSKELQFDGNKLFRWCMENLYIEQDAAGNCKPSKKKAAEKIDPVVAALMALELCSRENTPQQVPKDIWA
jgi:phage terminase large subunit-like protein